MIPLRLEELDLPDRLRRWHWVDFFAEGGYAKLTRTLKDKMSLCEPPDKAGAPPVSQRKTEAHSEALETERSPPFAVETADPWTTQPLLPSLFRTAAVMPPLVIAKLVGTKYIAPTLGAIGALAGGFLGFVIGLFVVGMLFAQVTGDGAFIALGALLGTLVGVPVGCRALYKWSKRPEHDWTP